MEAAIVARGLTKRYGRELVLGGIDLEVGVGESLGLMGPNGAGKSTLLKIIAGLEPYDSGQLYVRGRVGLVPQETILLPWRTLRGNILLAARLARIPRLDAEAELRWISEILGLREYLDLHPIKVSGGTARKTQIAMALITSPDILLLDEPFTGLDSQSVEALQDIVNWLHRRGLTIITVSHMVDELASISDKIAILTHKPARVREVVRAEELVGRP